jgi:flavin reductase (DIM6/NTAB) family NADH-FMN oxidoreductase RutF
MVIKSYVSAYAELSKTVVEIGNCSGSEVDKSNEFNLAIIEGDFVKVPLLQNCFANFECRLYNNKLIINFNFFIFEIVKAHVATSPKYPKQYNIVVKVIL